MTRLVHTLMLVVFLLFQVGTVVSVLADCCPGESAAECATDHCGEDCGDCLCALDRPVVAHPQIVLQAPVAPAIAPPAPAVAAPPEPRSGDILHVPRATLA
ncbi:MAG: hypothetical protein U0704_16695 [Candidatus Eisenbacteria bacterium]